MATQTQWLKLQILSAASGISFLGSAMTTFAVVLRDKNSQGPAGVSVLFLCMLLPSIFLSPWAGLLADRYSTRKLMPPLLALMSLCSLSLAFGFPIWWSYLALLVSSSANTAVNASFNALIPSLTTKEDLTRANGLQTTFSAMGSLIAPAAGGVLVSTTGFFWPFIIDSISFLVLIMVILLLKVDRTIGNQKEEGLKVLAGLKFVFQDKLVRSIVILVTVLIVSLGVIQVGEVFLIIDELQGNPLIYGLVGAIFASGAVIGGAFAALAKVPMRYHLTIVSVAIIYVAVAVITIGNAHHWWVVMVFGFMGGIAMSLLNAYGTGLVQHRTPDEVRGRVMSTFGAVITVGTATSMGLAGAAISTFGVRNVFVGAGILGLIIIFSLGPSVLKNRPRYPKSKTDAKASK
ncbi:MAG: MFS transporter [Micrococcales bacterium]|nr:MFS transporter [Micrococcales bacterium]NBR61751.1 MFS transporter [Actinomycetota bacterium]